MRRMLVGAALATLCAAVLIAEPKKIYSNDYLGQEPPALVVTEGHWFNSEKAPSLEALRGRVVYVEFSFMA